jgi:hypothetical protein
MKWIDVKKELPVFLKADDKESTIRVPVIRRNPTSLTQNFLFAHARKCGDTVKWFDDQLLEVDVAMWFPGVDPKIAYLALDFDSYPEGEKKEAVRKMIESS